MDLTFQVRMQYCSLQHRTLLLSPVTSTVRTGHETTDWSQIGKGVHQGCILSPCLFNFYAEYIMRNTGLDEAQAGIKISGRNTSNPRYADDTTLMAQSEEELKSLWKRLEKSSHTDIQLQSEINTMKQEIIEAQSWKVAVKS